MRNSSRQANQAFSTAKTKPGIWLALAIALGLHALVLLAPLPWRSPDVDPQSAQPVTAHIEVQLTRHDPAPEPEPTLIELPEPDPDDPVPLPDTIAGVAKEMKALPGEVSPTPLEPLVSRVKRKLENMSVEEKQQLTHTILSRQFITEDSAADRLFGNPVNPHTRDVQKEFHYPDMPNLVTMLDQPIPQLPFEYTPGLVYFAYAPGVKGELQRFWDVITPEFGWITRYGTEVRCVWVLVIAACGWK